MGNFWIPEKIDLTQDKNDYSNLTEAEKGAYDGILSFLIFLDSIQTNNIPNISDYITAPEVNLVLSIQTFQEAIHSQSYQYIIESILPKETRNSISYYMICPIDFLLHSLFKHLIYYIFIKEVRIFISYLPQYILK